MNNPITRPGQISRDEVDKIIHAIENRGGSITVSDPRLSSLIAWAGLILGSLLTGSIIWGVSTMQELNLKVGILIVQHEQDAKQNEERDRRIEALELRR